MHAHQTLHPHHDLAHQSSCDIAQVMEAVRCRTCNKHTHRNNYMQYFQNVSAEGLRNQVRAGADSFCKQGLAWFLPRVCKMSSCVKVAVKPVCGRVQF